MFKIGDPPLISFLNLILELNKILSRQTIAINVPTNNNLSIINKTLIILNVIFALFLNISVIQISRFIMIAVHGILIIQINRYQVIIFLLVVDPVVDPWV